MSPCKMADGLPQRAAVRCENRLRACLDDRVPAAAIALGGQIAAQASSPLPKPRATVTCATTVVASSFPLAPRDRSGMVVVLGAVAVPPPSALIRVYRGPAQRRYWRYGTKFAIWLRDGGPSVELTVPARLRKEVALQWGNSGNTSSIRFRSCPAVTGGMRGWTGGFTLSVRAVCAPMTIRVGTQTRRLVFSIGKRC